MRKLFVILLSTVAAVILVALPASASSGSPTVIGTGVLGAFGDPGVRLYATESAGGAQGIFSLAYPDTTGVLGSATCLFVSGTTAYLTAKITQASGPRAQANNWAPGHYIIIGVQDSVQGPDLLNFSSGFAVNPGCGPNFAATPVFPVITGLFRVSG